RLDLAHGPVGVRFEADMHLVHDLRRALPERYLEPRQQRFDLGPAARGCDRLVAMRPQERHSLAQQVERAPGGPGCGSGDGWLRCEQLLGTEDARVRNTLRLERRDPGLVCGFGTLLRFGDRADAAADRRGGPSTQDERALVPKQLEELGHVVLE